MSHLQSKDKEPLPKGKWCECGFPHETGGPCWECRVRDNTENDEEGVTSDPDCPKTGEFSMHGRARHSAKGFGKFMLACALAYLVLIVGAIVWAH